MLDPGAHERKRHGLKRDHAKRAIINNPRDDAREQPRPDVFGCRRLRAFDSQQSKKVRCWCFSRKPIDRKADELSDERLGCAREARDCIRPERITNVRATARHSGPEARDPTGSFMIEAPFRCNRCRRRWYGRSPPWVSRWQSTLPMRKAVVVRVGIVAANVRKSPRARPIELSRDETSRRCPLV
jgi:hypothetical protein